jgi:hypothetical protein
MISVVSLWLPILLSAVAVFILSSVIHMVFGYHNTDFKKLPSEDQVGDDLRKANIPPGDFIFPHAADMKERNSQEYKDKCEKGPNGVMTVFTAGKSDMTTSLGLWFVYSLVVGIFAAYVASRALEPSAHYLAVFRFVGVTAFCSYSLALLQQSIWYKKSWSSTFKSMFDGLLYALFTAGIFGWLWPSA